MVCCLARVNIYKEFYSELFLEGQYVELFGWGLGERRNVNEWNECLGVLLEIEKKSHL